MPEITLGIVRETKDPPDRRVPLTPRQCRVLQERYPGATVVVQPSEIRCFRDSEYAEEGIRVGEDLSQCHILMGVKEVSPETLLEDKTYLFFSHTGKKQPYNRGMLQAVVEKGIRLIDYEYLTGTGGDRVVAFGRWAGVVGAYNGLRAEGIRSGKFRLSPATELSGLDELKTKVAGVDLGRTRFVLTGGGRVAGGAVEVLEAAGIVQVEPAEYLEKEYDHPVFTRLDPWHYTRRSDGGEFRFSHFVEQPDAYENTFLPYAGRSDMYIACHFWDPRSPILLSRNDLAGLPLKVIADISCDIDGPIASTLRASTISEPFYGYDPAGGIETPPFTPGTIAVMAVDNLPGELPSDASEDFGSALMEHVIPGLFEQGATGLLERATITAGGRLQPSFSYLEDYLAGRE